MMEKPDCVRCRKIYAEKNKLPPCDTCIPKLHDENVDAVKVFTLVKNQLIFDPGSGQPVDLNLLAVMEAMKFYQVSDIETTLEKVMALGSHFILKQRAMRNANR